MISTLFCLHIVFGTISYIANVANSWFRSGYASHNVNQTTYVTKTINEFKRNRSSECVFVWFVWRMRCKLLVRVFAAGRVQVVLCGRLTNIKRIAVLRIGVFVYLCMCLTDNSSCT